MPQQLLEQTPVIILAGGLGTRLQPILSDRPKGLAPIGSRSFLEILIDLLKDQGAHHFVLCVGYKAEQIQTVLGDGTALGVKIEYSVEKDQLLGTAGALKLAESYFTPRALVLNGDTYFAIDYNAFIQRHIEKHQQAGSLATLALAPAINRSNYSSITLDPSGNFVITYKEKIAESATDANWVGAGAYVIEQALLATIPPDQKISIEQETFPQLLASGQKLAAMTAQAHFFDIGTPERWQIFIDHYLERQRAKINHRDTTAS